MKDFFGVFLLTDNKQKKGIYLFCFLLVIVSCLEVLSIGMVIPFSLVILNDSDYLFNINLIFTKFNVQPINDLLTLKIIILFLFLFIFIIKFISISILSSNKNKFVYRLKASWQQKVFLNYLKKDYFFFYKKNQSNLILNCINHIDNFTQNGLLGIMEFITEIVILLSLFILLLFLEPLGCFFVSLIGLLFFLIYSYLTKNKIKKLGLLRAVSEKNLYKNTKETLSGLKEIFMYQKQEYFFEKFRLSSNMLAESNFKHQTLSELPKFLLELLAVLCFVVLVLILLTFDNYTGLVLTKLGVFAAVTFKLLPSLNRLSVSLTKIRYGISSFDAIKNEVIPHLNTENNMFIKKKKNLLFEKFIELKNVDFSYTDTKVLSSINLQIKKNSIIGIEGDSGSGKSTLVNIISGLLKPNKGYVLVDGIKINKDNIDSWMSKIGYIPQDLFLLEDTIKNNIIFHTPCSSKEHNQNLINIYKKTNLNTFVYKFKNKFNTVIHKNPNNLSGGQIQRIAIARTLYKGSDLLILDEATSSLDLKNQKKIVKILKDLKKQKTIIIISHQNFIYSICDVVYKISDGKISLVKK
jgi:ABC-type multidrug transport system fused ATPase/permease subunit